MTDIMSYHRYSSGSSPHAMSQSVVSSQGHSDHAAMSLAAEKKRNKLGYHRTSVACGHCRRRKIRCIPSPGDTQGRCINCIRLKKECSFYPVDQQPPPEARKSSQSSTMVPLKPETYSAAKIPSRHSLDYTHSGLPGWMADDASPSSSKPSDMEWRAYEEESRTRAFSSYATHAAAVSTIWTPQSESAGSRAVGDLWPDAVGNSDSHHHIGQQAYPSISQMTRGAHHRSGGTSSGSGSGSSSYDRRPSGAALSDSNQLYQSPMDTAATEEPAGIDGIGTTLDSHVSLSAGSAYPGWQQPYSYSKDAGDYVNWGHPSAPGGEHAAPGMYYTR